MRKPAVLKKLAADGFGESKDFPSGEEEEEEESDIEIQRIFKHKKNLKKPKLNLEYHEESTYGTSISSLSENMHSDEHSSINIHTNNNNLNTSFSNTNKNNNLNQNIRRKKGEFQVEDEEEEEEGED
jgi:hypothetical protein